MLKWYETHEQADVFRCDNIVRVEIIHAEGETHLGLNVTAEYLGHDLLEAGEGDATVQSIVSEEAVKPVVNDARELAILSESYLVDHLDLFCLLVFPLLFVAHILLKLW